MTDLEDQLHRMLARRAGEVEPHLTGTGIRALAGRRHAQRLRVIGPAAGTVLAAALLITPFVLVHHGDSAPHRPAVILPAGPGSSSVADHPPSATSEAASVVASPATPTLSAVPRPTAPSRSATSGPVTSPAGPVSLASTTPSGSVVSPPPDLPSSSSTRGGPAPTPTPTR